MNHREFSAIALAVCAIASSGCRDPRLAQTVPLVARLQSVTSYSLVRLEENTPDHYFHPASAVPLEKRDAYTVVGEYAFLTAAAVPGKGTFPARELRHIFTHDYDRPPCDCRGRDKLAVLLYDADKALLGVIVVDNHEGFILADKEGHLIKRTCRIDAWGEVMRRLEAHEAR